MVHPEENIANYQNEMDITYEQYFKSLFKTIVDIFELLEDEIGREEALRRISKFSEDKSVENRKNILKSLDIDDFQDFLEIYKAELESPVFKNCLSYRVEEETKKKFKYRVTECIWADTFKDLDAEDIGYEISCKPDFKVAPLYHPNIRLKRTKTLMQGDECCNFEYIWRED